VDVPAEHRVPMNRAEAVAVPLVGIDSGAEECPDPYAQEATIEQLTGPADVDDWAV
jgi:hypothetical protein